MTFTNPQQIKRYILDRCADAVEKAKEDIYDKLDMFLKLYYADYEPVAGGYVRTGQLMRSLVMSDVKKTSNGYEAYVYFDFNKMNYVTGRQPSGQQVVSAAAQGLHGATGLLTVGGNNMIDIWGMPLSVLHHDFMPKLKQYLIESGIPVK